MRRHYNVNFTFDCPDFYYEFLKSQKKNYNHPYRHTLTNAIEFLEYFFNLDRIESNAIKKLSLHIDQLTYSKIDKISNKIGVSKKFTSLMALEQYRIFHLY